MSSSTCQFTRPPAYAAQEHQGWDILRALSSIKAEYRHDPVTLKAAAAVEKRVRMVRRGQSDVPPVTAPESAGYICLHSNIPRRYATNPSIESHSCIVLGCHLCALHFIVPSGCVYRVCLWGSYMGACSLASPGVLGAGGSRLLPHPPQGRGHDVRARCGTAAAQLCV